MATILRILNATRELGKSQGYLGLPLRDTFVKLAPELIGIRDETIPGNADGVEVHAMISAWELTPRELQMLIDGAGTLKLRVLGKSHPPVMIYVDRS